MQSDAAGLRARLGAAAWHYLTQINSNALAEQIQIMIALEDDQAGPQPLVRGDPAECIIEASTRESADALVVGRRGRDQLAGLLLGSVSQKLANLAPCSTVIVP